MCNHIHQCKVWFRTEMMTRKGKCNAEIVFPQICCAEGLNAADICHCKHCQVQRQTWS